MERSFGMKTLIEKIHARHQHLKIIEMGCGATVMNTLCEVAGASNTIYWAKAPYSKEYVQRKFLIPKNQRIVSRETVERVLSLEELTEKVNYIYVASFQIGPGCSTHGYIGLKNAVGEYIYHVSIHEELKREEYLKLIAEIGIKIIGQWIDDAVQLDYIDSIWINGALRKAVLISEIYKSKKFSTFVFEKNKWKTSCERLESLLRRDNKGLIIYKGSFNPLTIAHDAIRRKTQEMYPDYSFVYSLSLNTFDKNTGWLDLATRAQDLSAKNDLLVTTEPSFHKLIEICHQKAPDKHLVFPMGYDTWTRFFRDHDHNPENIEKIPATFLVAPRDGESFDLNIKNVRCLEVEDSGISSTMIREKLDNGENVEEYLA